MESRIRGWPTGAWAYRKQMENPLIREKRKKKKIKTNDAVGNIQNPTFKCQNVPKYKKKEKKRKEKEIYHTSPDYSDYSKQKEEEKKEG